MTNDEPGFSQITDPAAACEEIFQHHKRHIIVNRAQDTYPNIDSTIEGQAMDSLERQIIIFKPNPSDPSITQINPIVTSASSYHEALKIIKEKGVRTQINTTIIPGGPPLDILEPPGKKKSKALWIIIAIIIVLFLLFNFVPFYKWL